MFTAEQGPTYDIDRSRRRRNKIQHDGTVLAEDGKDILRCLGAAVMMQWNMLPAKLQRELFDRASSIGELQQRTLPKGEIARFLHNHKDDESDDESE